ncbi:MAG: phage portal protein [Hyphomicrobiaceae bacterium]|nr:phage portal protein [Hyphomicrobiaceae bacterium]
MPSFLNKLSALFEQKQSATGALIALQSAGQPVWTPRDYGALAREGFMQNAIVYRCVRMIAESAASVPLRVHEGAEVLDEHPLLSLLQRPNSAQSGSDLLEDWYGYLMVAGNAYLEAVSNDREVLELHVLRPDRMKLVPGEDGWPEFYEYSVAGRQMRFHQAIEGQKPILHMSLFNPLNDHYGMSPLEAAAFSLDIHNAAGGWNKALLDNAARPSGALVYGGKENSLSVEQFDRLKAELESSHQGAMNAGRPMLLEGGLDWKPMGYSPRDMDFIEAKWVAAREIALALGVPPMLLGIPGDNTYSNYQEANRTFWRQTVLPLVNRTSSALCNWLDESAGAELSLKPDLNNIEALSGERDARWQRIAKADFLTTNEKREALGYGPLEEGEQV